MPFCILFVYGVWCFFFFFFSISGYFDDVLGYFQGRFVFFLIDLIGIVMAAPPARARADYDYLIKLLLIGDSGA